MRTVLRRNKLFRHWSELALQTSRLALSGEGKVGLVIRADRTQQKKWRLGQWGSVLGGVIGAAAALLIPGFGPAIAGGILAATFGGMAIGAAAGGIIGALTKVGVPEEEAHYYQSEFEAGQTIVTVRSGNRQQEAVGILRQYGAYDATTRAEASTPHRAPEAYDPTAPARPSDPNRAPGTYDPTRPRTDDSLLS